MLNGANINAIKDAVPLERRPQADAKGQVSAYFGRFSHAAGNQPAVDPAVLEHRASLQRQEDALTHHNLSVAAADRGEVSAGGRALTGAAATIARNHHVEQEEKKRDREYEERALKSALEAMKQRFDEIAEYWGKIADDYEKKLGGLDSIGQQLGTKRKPGQSEEDYRRELNDLILYRISVGEIDPNSDMAQMAYARDNQYEAQEAGQEADALIREGKTEEAERLVEELEGKVLNDRTANELNNVEVIEIIDAETRRRDDFGRTDNFSTNVTEQRDGASIDFWATGNDDFAVSAQSLAMTENFNTAAAGMISAPTQEIALNQQMKFGALKPTGMVGG